VIDMADDHDLELLAGAEEPLRYFHSGDQKDYNVPIAPQLLERSSLFCPARGRKAPLGCSYAKLFNIVELVRACRLDGERAWIAARLR